MPQREIELILARQLATGLAVPVLLVDAGGDTLFYNEPAERIFGRRFDEVDELPFDERTATLAPRDAQNRALPRQQLPGMIAMRERRPVHAELFMHGLDGELRWVEATAIPLESAGGRVLGAFVIMWRPPTGTPPPGSAVPTIDHEPPGPAGGPPASSSPP